MSHPIYKATVAAGAALAFVFTACGGSDKPSSTPQDARDAPSDYCALAAELRKQEDFASPSQLEALQAAAPEELRDEFAVVVPALTDATNAGDFRTAFNDPKVDEDFHVITKYDAEVCGLPE